MIRHAQVRKVRFADDRIPEYGRFPEIANKTLGFQVRLQLFLRPRNEIVPVNHGIEFDGSRFWVIHRRKKYGPFDYEWSSDFCGVEMLYGSTKFGEYCSVDEVFADLKQFGLPMSVVSVTSIVIGCVLFGVLEGLPESERLDMVAERLKEHGFERFSLDS